MLPVKLRHLAVPIGDIRLDPNNVNKHDADRGRVTASGGRRHGRMACEVRRACRRRAARPTRGRVGHARRVMGHGAVSRFRVTPGRLHEPPGNVAEMVE